MINIIAGSKQGIDWYINIKHLEDILEGCSFIAVLVATFTALDPHNWFIELKVCVNDIFC